MPPSRRKTGLRESRSRACSRRCGRCRVRSSCPRRKKDAAYRNRPLPIGHGQTISQPYIVALMTDLLRLEPHHRVLEVGTGSGYQAAVLSRLAAEVFSIEIIEPLGLEAAADARPARDRQRQDPDRGRLRGVAGACALRRHHRHGGARTHSGPARRAIKAGGAAGDPGRRLGSGPQGRRKKARWDHNLDRDNPGALRALDTGKA